MCSTILDDSSQKTSHGCFVFAEIKSTHVEMSKRTKGTFLVISYILFRKLIGFFIEKLPTQPS